MSMERQIAGTARDLVTSQKQEGDEKHEKESGYRALCESFPILLRSAGLAQTLSYLRAKKQGEYGELYGHLERQFRDLEFLGKEALSEKAADPRLSTADYRLYSEVAMQVALWHKRLAQALLRQREAKKP